MKTHSFIKYTIASTLFVLGCNAYAKTDIQKSSVYDNNAQLYSASIQPRLADEDKDGVIDGRDLCPNTPANATVNNDGCPSSSTKLLSLDLNVLFDSGKADVKPTYYSKIKELAAFMKNNPASSVQIEGYTDNVGKDEYNKALSQRRAVSIANVLIHTFRIDESRVEAIGHGEENPIDSNDTAQGREKNRRVVAEVYAKQKVQATRWTIYSVDKSNTAFNTSR